MTAMMKMATIGVVWFMVAAKALCVEVAPVRLVKLPDAPLATGSATLYCQDFEAQPVGASGEFHLAEGRWGQGLHLNMPDGRYDVDATELSLGATGTIEWWVRPRPATQAWRDQAWRFFLHVRPAEAGGFQLDLWRHPRTGLRLTASMGLQPYGPIEGPDEKLQVQTGDADVEQWHHLLVSWDLSGERQRVWLLFDGEGQVLSVPAGTFIPGSFASIEFGNRPSGWDTPHIPMDGGIDDIHVSNVSVAERLAR